MSVEIQFYDKDVIKNILGPISMKPEKIILFYDSGLKDKTCFLSLEKCYKRHIPGIIIETIPVNIMDVNSMFSKIREKALQNENSYIELSGGSELMIIAGYKAAVSAEIPAVYTDPISESIINIDTGEIIKRTEILSLIDFIESKGAGFLGNSKMEPEEKDFDRILKMARYLFKNLESWKRTCSYLQTAAAGTDPNDLFISLKIKMLNRNGKHVQADKKVLEEFMRNGFIEDLNFTNERVKFKFTSSVSKQYMINFGVWLELYVYIEAVKTGEFDDVRLGALIDWNIYDGVDAPGNEFDVVVSDRSIPVFISCKLREANTAALNELVVAKKRFGGWFSKTVIVEFGYNKENITGTYKRAEELGIEMLDKKDVLSSNFGERLVKAIKGHDLVSLKWGKV